MKKLLRFFRAIAVMVLWTWVFVYITDAIFILVWNFDYTRTGSWEIMFDYWNSGGVIKTASDVILIISLILVPFLWLWGYRKSLRVNYLQLLLKPVNMVYDLFNRSSDNSDRVVIRNIKSSSQQIEDIKNELNSLKPQKAKETNDIRYNLKEKVTDELKK